MAYASANGNAIERRLDELTGGRVKDPKEETRHKRLLGALKRLGTAAPQSAAETGKLQMNLVRAGYRSYEAIAVFFGIRLGVALLAFSLLATPVFMRPNLAV